MAKRHVHTPNVPNPQLNEAYCEDCGQLYNGKGKWKAGPGAATTGPKAASDVLASVAAEVAGMDSAAPEVESRSGTRASFDLGATASDIQSPTVVDVVKPPPTWCRMAGKQIADAYVMIVQGSLRRYAKREAKEPEQDNVDELGTALGEQLAIWFPDSEMTPVAKIAIAAAAVTATMVVGSTPITPPARSVGSNGQTGGAVQSAEMPAVNHTPESPAVTLPPGLL